MSQVAILYTHAARSRMIHQLGGTTGCLDAGLRVDDASLLFQLVKQARECGDSYVNEHATLHSVYYFTANSTEGTQNMLSTMVARGINVINAPLKYNHVDESGQGQTKAVSTLMSYYITLLAFHPEISTLILVDDDISKLRASLELFVHNAETPRQVIFCPMHSTSPYTGEGPVSAQEPSEYPSSVCEATSRLTDALGIKTIPLDTLRCESFLFSETKLDAITNAEFIKSRSSQILRVFFDCPTDAQSRFLSALVLWLRIEHGHSCRQIEAKRGRTPPKKSSTKKASKHSDKHSDKRCYADILFENPNVALLDVIAAIAGVETVQSISASGHYSVNVCFCSSSPLWTATVSELSIRFLALKTDKSATAAQSLCPTVREVDLDPFIQEEARRTRPLHRNMTPSKLIRAAREYNAVHSATLKKIRKGLKGKTGAVILDLDNVRILAQSHPALLKAAGCENMRLNRGICCTADGVKGLVKQQLALTAAEAPGLGLPATLEEVLVVITEHNATNCILQGSLPKEHSVDEELVTQAAAITCLSSGAKKGPPFKLVLVSSDADVLVPFRQAAGTVAKLCNFEIVMPHVQPPPPPAQVTQVRIHDSLLVFNGIFSLSGVANQGDTAASATTLCRFTFDTGVSVEQARQVLEQFRRETKIHWRVVQYSDPVMVLVRQDEIHPDYRLPMSCDNCLHADHSETQSTPGICVWPAEAATPAQVQPQRDPSEFQGIRTRKQRRKERKERKQKRVHLQTCPFSISCAGHGACGKQHTKHEKAIFQLFQVGGKHEAIPICRFKSKPCTWGRNCTKFQQNPLDCPFYHYKEEGYCNTCNKFGHPECSSDTQSEHSTSTAGLTVASVRTLPESDRASSRSPSVCSSARSAERRHHPRPTRSIRDSWIISEAFDKELAACTEEEPICIYYLIHGHCDFENTGCRNGKHLQSVWSLFPGTHTRLMRSLLNRTQLCKAARCANSTCCYAHSGAEQRTIDQNLHDLWRSMKLSA